MERIFRPTKWFVAFCALLVLIWGLYQLVAHLRVENDARQAAEEIFAWTWPDKSWDSKAQIARTCVRTRKAAESTVLVEGSQLLTRQPYGGTMPETQRFDMKAILTFYRSGDSWVLGRVELP